VRRPATRELALCALVLVAVAAILYASRVAHGSFAWDDWQNAQFARFGAKSAIAAGPFDIREAIYEPGVALLLPLPHLVFGLDASWHLALAALLGVALSLCAFALFRELGLELAASLVAAALVLVFPWSDSTRLWATGGIDLVAGCLYLAGAAVALRGLRAPPVTGGRQRNVSLLLYAASMLTYPAATPLVALSTLLYRLRVPWPAAWKRGRWDLALALAVLVFDALLSTKPKGSLGDDIDHAGTIVDQWLTVLARSLEPFGDPPRGWVLLAAGALVVACELAARLRRAAAAARLRRWLLIAAGGAFATAVAYSVFALGEAKYVPLAPGLYNRVGMLAAPGFALAVVGLAGALVELLAGAQRRAQIAAIAAAALAVAVGVGWALEVGEDSDRWNEAASQSRRVLSTLTALVPDPAPGTVIYADGYPRYVAPGYPVFASSFDLDAAAKVTWDDEEIDAYPLPGPLRCGPEDVAPRDPPYDGLDTPAPYGRVVVIDVAGGSATTIKGPESPLCRQAG
jgi:hypothetical protein